MNNNDIIKQFKGILESSLATARAAAGNEAASHRLLNTVGQNLATMLTPFLMEIARSSNLSKAEMRELMQQLSAEVANRGIKDVDTAPIISIIEQTMSKVQPRVMVNVPPIKVPEVIMPEEMQIRGWVSLMGVDLNNPLPVQLRDMHGNPVSFNQSVSSAGGGKADFFTIKDIRASSVSLIDQDTGALKVTMSSSATGGLTDGELRASAVPVSQVSGANWSVAVIDIFGSTSASSVFNADNRIKVSVETGGSGLTDSELRASAVPVMQVSGSGWTTETSGNVANDVTDTGNPVKIGGKVRQTLPSTSLDNADRADAIFDDLGRMLIRPIQVRDLTKTAYVQLTNGTETTFLAASAGHMHDLIAVVGANNSDAAVSVDIRAVTGGNVATTLQIPANGTAGFTLPLPYPQNDTGNNWTADMGDITGTTVSLTGLFTREI